MGAAVIARLLAAEPRPRLRAFVHAEFDALRLRDQGVEAVVGDLVTGRGVDEAMRGVTALIYAADTAGRSGDVVTNELEAVQHALIAARAAGVRRVVALSHVAASEEAYSRYLVARWGVELAVRQSSGFTQAHTELARLYREAGQDQKAYEHEIKAAGQLEVS